MPEDEGIIVSKDNIEQINLLSKKVVICLEIISSFSADGKYLSPEITEGRMSPAEVNEIYTCLYGKLNRFYIDHPKKLQKLKSKKILKLIRPAHPFILGIYRNGTPDHLFKSMRADESIHDDFILEQFAIEFKQSIIQGTSYITDFTKQYYGSEQR